MPELIGDDRFVDAAARLRNKQALWAILEARVATRPAAEWVDLLTAASVPVAPVRNVLEALQDARDADDGSLITVRGETAEFENVATPIRFVNTADVDAAYPPALGGDTFALLTEELGYSESDVQTMVDDHVLGATRVGAAVR